MNNTQLVANFMGIHIAEFRKLDDTMGYVVAQDAEGNYTWDEWLTHYRPDTDWGQLMAGIGKMQTIDGGRYKYKMDKIGVQVIDYSDPNEPEIVDVIFDDEQTLIQRYFTLLIEFIKWYNENKKTEQIPAVEKSMM